MKNTLKSGIKDLRSILVRHKTHLRTCSAIVSILEKFSAGQTINPNHYSEQDGLQEAMEAQEEIGWVNFILGRWTTKWLVVQKNYYSRLNICNSPKRWVIAIIHKLLMITWNLWDFRNGFIHSPSGPLARQEHHTLNLQIDAQWD